ncbi:hypothetical protein H0H92_016038 [Tricholoma furcatifolium]|nr:hypothetical protein H0H92_016038 [Tricholoma furcatifolium]
MVQVATGLKLRTKPPSQRFPRVPCRWKMLGDFNADDFFVPRGQIARNGELSHGEFFWRKHCQFLKDRGYTLRARYQPDWRPSWLNTSKRWSDCEDGGKLMDATRADGTVVMLKAIDPTKRPEEIPCGKLLSSERLASPRNRCMHYLEVIEQGPNQAFIVMPLLIYTDAVPFETIGEVVEFFRQIFEWNNIMADAAHLFDIPPHPFDPRHKRDFSGYVHRVASRTKRPVKYYLIDFGLSKEYPPGTPRLEPVPWGGDKSVPEHQLPGYPPCDPFPVDVYCLGNCIREEFLDGWKVSQPKQGFDFMRDLADDMTNPDPRKRPTMREAAHRLNVIIEGLSDRKLRSPFLEVGKKMTFMESFTYWMKQYIRKARRIPAIPRA